MAGRPQKYNLDLFRHINSMRNDLKIKSIRGKFGNEGYALYCMMLEVLSEQNGLKYPASDISIELLAGDFAVSSDFLKSFFDHCYKLNLLQLEKDQIICNQLIERHQDILSRRINTAINPISDAEIELMGTEIELPSRVKRSIDKDKDKDKGKEFAFLLFAHWKSKKNLINHSKLTSGMEKNISSRLQEYSIEELKQCIDNYDKILSDNEKYWYSYKNALDEFFRSGEKKPAPYLKFMPDRFVESNYLRDKSQPEKPGKIKLSGRPD